MGTPQARHEIEELASLEYGLDLTEYLQLKGTSPKRFFEELVRTLKPKQGDMIFVAGSLCDKLGNAESDVDVYLISPTPPPLENQGSVYPHNIGQVTLDIELWLPDQVTSLVNRLQSLSARSQERGHLSATLFKPEEREFLHRLKVGIPAWGSEELARLQKRIDPKKLSRQIFDRAQLRVGTAHQDILGLLEAGDRASVFFLCHTLIGFMMDAVLAATGNTNPTEKWRMRLLRRLDATGWDANLPAGPLRPSTTDYFMNLSLLPQCNSPLFVQRVYDCITLANRLIPWGQHRFYQDETGLAQHPDPEPREEPVGATATTNQQLPPLRWDVQIRYIQGDLRLFGIRGGPSHLLNQLSLETLVFFDGKSTIYDALEHLRRRSSATEADLLTAIDDLRNYLFFKDLIHENLHHPHLVVT